MEINSIWNGWRVDKLIGEGTFGKVYRIVREEFGHTYESALKVIRIPQNPAEATAIRNEGMDEESVTTYFRSMMENIVSEFALMSQLRGNSNIVSYEDHSVVKLEDTFGWEVYIRMEMLTPLFTYMRTHTMTIRDIIRLGIDMCKALEVCQKYNIIHRDIKPENIFYSEQGTFKLGDFGIAREMEKTTAGMSKKGTYSYMAPEVYKGAAYNSTVDIYSLGIVLYRFLNNNRTPFLPAFPEAIRYSDRENANILRMSGEPLPYPCNAQGRLGEIVLKACAYDPKDRYESALEMRKALEAIAYSEEEASAIYPMGDTLKRMESTGSSPDRSAETSVTAPLAPADADRPKAGNAPEQKAESEKPVPVMVEEEQAGEPSAAVSPEPSEKATDPVSMKKAMPAAASPVPEEPTMLLSEERSEEQIPKTPANADVMDKAQEGRPVPVSKAADAAQENGPGVTAAPSAGGKKRPGPAVWAAVAAAVIVVLCGSIFGYQYTHHEVPALISMDADMAKSALEKEGLKYHEKDRVFSDSVARNSVVSQSIEMGEKVRKGSTVDVVISKGAPIKLPDLKGKKKDSAEKTLSGAKLQMEVSGEAFSDSIGKGKVISQKPEPGTECEETQKISVVISKGVEQVTVPDVTGKSQEEAEKALETAKLKSETESVYSSDVESGYVVSQSEEAGESIDKNSTVTISVSIGPQPQRSYSGGSSKKRSGGGSGHSSGGGGGGGGGYEEF